MKLGLENQYAALPERFFSEISPVPVKAPELLAVNAPLARLLGLVPPGNDRERLQWTALFSGNEIPEDARPLAMAYAGHQFAHFVPQLGDGRALLLGERRALDGRLYDIQLKGSGITPFSRAGDGRAAVGPMLREYLVSEAMHALGIPTTRSLAVVATGERVFRDELLPGAILTRVAASHVRVGTFQYFAARGDEAALRALVDFTIARHDAELAGADDPALALLGRVVARQARLIAQWMSVGFIHGVMNTDNMALSGETIDYGPCAFMDHYDPHTVFSSIDHRGRYAYGNQPAVAQWNLARFAETLVPLIHGDTEQAVQLATEAVQAFTPAFDTGFLGIMAGKLGITAPDEEQDAPLVSGLLQLMRDGRADFTNTLRALADAATGESGETALRAQFSADAQRLDEWLQRWRARLATQSLPPDTLRAALRAANPAYIPRNHRVQAALDAASNSGDMAPFERLLVVLQRPFEEHPGAEDLARPPRDDERILATFCGT